MKHNNLKVNKSEIARALNINRRTVTKYLNGFQKCTHRNKPSRLDEYTDIISELLSSNTQVFAYRTGSVNQSFEAFADDYGFSVKPCIAATPRTKGKVETQMKFLDEIKAYSGQLNLTELLALVERINMRINSSIHQGTGKITTSTIRVILAFLRMPCVFLIFVIVFCVF